MSIQKDMACLAGLVAEAARLSLEAQQHAKACREFWRACAMRSAERAIRGSAEVAATQKSRGSDGGTWVVYLVSDGQYSVTWVGDTGEQGSCLDNARYASVAEALRACHDVDQWSV